MEVFVVLCWIIWPILCYNLAVGKNRSGALAIVAGLVFGVFAVMYYAVVGKVE